MPDPQFLTTPQGRRIAYHSHEGTGPGLVFLGGFMSDMEGTKAVHLEKMAQEAGRRFLRFDYSGHGQSSGAFADGCIGDWAEDAEAAITSLTTGPQVLIGSSMGGWISLLMTQRIRERVAGLVTIAAAPDFTEDSMWAGFTPEQQETLMTQGEIKIPSDYDDPYTITRRLIEDGRKQRVLTAPLDLPFPVRFLQGTADTDVEMSVALRLLDHAQGPDMHLSLLKGGDHRFSSPQALQMVDAAVQDVLSRIAS
ncbi:alpha/beta hydrolase [Alphaproteobacteria bacterium KMM 3653]|uniref:Palmitoyl-protein thioesterase ABHD10, mitochondrial n=1 Tax=Harenicola maris TaxID=2841044 RepID=A0AAP2CVA4_9RHOB|nr:alpha/beta hydrolase [Harenicola maris]